LGVHRYYEAEAKMDLGDDQKFSSLPYQFSYPTPAADREQIHFDFSFVLFDEFQYLTEGRIV
jgi:hypothetical protein